MPLAAVREHIAENYRYDPETGEFWRRAGSLHPTGYQVVAGTVGEGKERQRWAIKGHRLAHYFMTGEWLPDNVFMDHINRKRADNRWANLRVCTAEENARNRRPWGKVASRGVQLKRQAGEPVFVAEIGTWPNRKILGSFTTEQEAAAAYNRAAQNRNGQFANLNP